jgi:hypothetical protein
VAALTDRAIAKIDDLMSSGPRLDRSTRDAAILGGIGEVRTAGWQRH